MVVFFYWKLYLKEENCVLMSGKECLMKKAHNQPQSGFTGSNSTVIISDNTDYNVYNNQV